MSDPSTRGADLGIALLRTGLGTMWIAHALLKLFIFTLPGTAQWFISIGFPGWVLGVPSLPLARFADAVACGRWCIQPSPQQSPDPRPLKEAT
jgi:uncharacterized membrane protein YphA (DoxX/SURF4 family)